MFSKLDIDKLYDDSEARGLFDSCPTCCDASEGRCGPHVLCWICGVCFKYCHDDYFHEMDYSEGGVGQP